jgi:hypothetical protein
VNCSLQSSTATLVRSLCRIASAATAGCSVAGTGLAAQHRTNLACHAELGPPTLLRTESGRRLYVEPMAHSVSNTELFIAGRPTILWGGGGPFTADSVIGAIATRSGRVRLVPSPVNPRLVGVVRASGRPDGSWDVVIAERSASSRSDSVTRLWHGVYDGQTWSSIQPIPLPPAVAPLFGRGSDLVRGGERLAWALRVANSDARTDVALFVLRDGRWSSEVVPTRRAAYAALSYTESLGFQLAVVGVDLSQLRDDNSLFLWTERPSWSVRRISLGNTSGPAHHPGFSGSSGGSVLTWYAEVADRREVRAVFDLHSRSADSPLVVDPSAADQAPTPGIDLPTGQHFWISQHQAPGDAERQLRIVQGSPAGTLNVTSFPSPFTTSIRAIAWESNVVIVGGVRDLQGFSTALLPARISCPREIERARPTFDGRVTPTERGL